MLPAAARPYARQRGNYLDQVKAIEDPATSTAGVAEDRYFYDNKQRAIQVQTINYKGGLNQTTQLYNSSGQLLCTYEVHNNASSNMIEFPVKTNRVYDAAGRLLSLRKTLLDDNNPTAPSTTQRILASYVYDAMGQLNGKKDRAENGISGSAPLTTAMETQVHDYNIRGWLLGINRDYVKNAGSSYLDLNWDTIKAPRLSPAQRTTIPPTMAISAEPSGKVRVMAKGVNTTSPMMGKRDDLLLQPLHNLPATTSTSTPASITA